MTTSPSRASALALLLLAASAAPALHAQRSVAQTLRSDTLPRVEVDVDPALTYLGRVDLDVQGKARAEQHWFAEHRGGRIVRAVIVHFEHFLPTNDHTFDYPRLRMARLGRHEFLHQTWPLVDWELFRFPEVRALLARHGLEPEADWLSDRHVRVVDEAKKHELILFYVEPESALDVAVEELRPGGRARARWPAVEAALAERARRAYRVRD
jgi:hypothetical protein